MSLGHGASIVRNGLVLHLDAANSKSYPGSGTSWFDLASSSYTGSLINGVAYSPDNKGILTFDGTNDYVTISSSPILTTVTCESWFRISGTTTYSMHPVCQKEGGNSGGAVYGIRVTEANRLPYGQIFYSALAGESRTVTASTAMITGVWYHLVITYDSLFNLKIYVNGVLENTAIGTAVPRQNSGSLSIGRGDARYAKGNIGLVSIYNRDLTASEIQRNFEATRGRYGI